MSNATELLRRIQRYIGNQYLTTETLELSNDIDDFLAAEPEAEPVAWMHPNGGVIQTRLTGLERDTYTIPLYTRPEPARKPMTEEEIARGFYSGRWLYEDFEAGVRWAEKMHKIGESNE